MGYRDHPQSVRARVSVLSSPSLSLSLSSFTSHFDSMRYHNTYRDMNRLLSDITVNSLSSLHSSLRHLHTIHGLPHIVLSSIPLPIKIVSDLDLPVPPDSYACFMADFNSSRSETIRSDPEDHEILVCFASSFIDGRIDTWAFRLPTLPGYFSGVGDLFSALVLGHLDDDARHRSDLPVLPYAVSKALLTVQQILLKTHLFFLSQARRSNDAEPRRMHHSAGSLRRDRTSDAIDQSASHPNVERSLDYDDPMRKAIRTRKRELRIIPERGLIIDNGQGWPGRRMDWSSS